MFAALHIPELPLIAVLQDSPELSQKPCVVIDSSEKSVTSRQSKACVLFANSQAQDAAVYPGLSATRALARCPSLIMRERSPDREAILQQQLVSFSHTLSPDLEITPPSTTLIDLSTSALALQSPEDWIQHVLEKGFLHPLHIALAHTPDLATIAVHQRQAQDPFCVLRKASLIGQTALADVPLVPPFLLQQLDTWGIHQVSQFTALPHSDLTDRLGASAGTLHHILTGKEKRLLTLDRSPQVFVHELDLEDSVTTTEQLCLLLESMLTTLCTRLTRAHRVAATLDLFLRYDHSAGNHNCSLRIADPTAQIQILLEIVRVNLENHRSPAPVTRVRLQLHPATAQRSQRDLFAAGLKDPNRFHHTLSQVEAIVGKGQIGFPHLMNTHRPDSCTVIPYSEDPPKAAVPAEFLPSPTLPARRFRPPQEIAVAYAEHRGTEGLESRPAAILTGRYRGTVVQCHGPHIISGNWWQPGSQWKYKEWDVQLHTHQLLRLAQTRSQPPQWFLVATY